MPRVDCLVIKPANMSGSAAVAAPLSPNTNKSLNTRTAAPAQPYEGHMQLTRDKDFYDYYNVIREMGSGNFSKVFEVRNKLTRKLYACKVLDKTVAPPRDVEMVRNEINLLKGMSHARVVSLVRTFESSRRLYLILELLTGGELYYRVVDYYQNGFDEIIAANMFAQILEGVKYLHDRGVAHRDLKPENIIFEITSTETLVKIIDFGLSRRVRGTERLFDAVGTPQYVAPEVLRATGHGIASDVWSLGVLLYTILTGYCPFHVPSSSSRNELLYKQIVSGRFEFPRRLFKNVSPEAIDLIKRMMTVDESKRISVREALEHPWIVRRELNNSARLRNAMQRCVQNGPGA